MNAILNIPRLWYPGTEKADTDLLHRNTYDSLVKYSNQQPLSHYQRSPFLFLLGQAGAGKSTYLKNTYKAKPTFLYIDIKKLGTAFIDELQNSDKWRNFTGTKNIDVEYFTLLLDGWDELVEELQARSQLIRVLSKIPEILRTKLRVRIACRPEILEKQILEDLHADCQWLVSSLDNPDDYRILLSPLCSDQIREVYKSLSSNNDLNEFWEWCVLKNVHSLTGHIQTLLFLIESFLKKDKNTWNSLPELWEEILSRKVQQGDRRDIDNKRLEQLFTKNHQLDCLGDLALYYLFNERKPLPHIVRSNGIFDLPSFRKGNGVQSPAIQFLLSSPVFTPGGIDNIHFAQAQEAEFLAARRLVNAKIGLDNLKGLFIVENSVSKHLQGLCKWVAKYDPEWRTFLLKENPNIAVSSLDILVDSVTRSSLIKNWWFNSKSFLHDWDTLYTIPVLLKGTDFQWLEEEIKIQCESNNSKKLEILIHLINELTISKKVLTCLFDFLNKLSDESELYLKILQILSKNHFGELNFWLNESNKDNSFKGGEKIPSIMIRLKELGTPMEKLLQTIIPVGDYSQHYHYTDYLKNFFETITLEDIPTALVWFTRQDIGAGCSDLFWLNGAVNGFLINLYRNNQPQAFLMIAQKIWSEYDSVQRFFVKDENPGENFLKEFRTKLFESLIENNDVLKSFIKAGFNTDPWIFPVEELEKLLEKFQFELERIGYTEYAQNLLSLADWRRDQLCLYIERLCECKKYMISIGSFENSILESIIGPLKINSEWAINAKKYHEQNLKWKTEHIERSKRTEENLKKGKEIFQNDFKELSKKNWYECYNFLTYGYNWEKEGNYGPFPIEYVGTEFWFHSLTPEVRQTLQNKAADFVHTFAWNSDWEKAFSQRKESNSFSTHNYTTAPYFAWQLLHKVHGYTEFDRLFSQIDKYLWLKYLWTYACYHSEPLEIKDWLFLLQNIEVCGLHSIWGDVKEQLGRSATLPQEFCEIDLEVIKHFLLSIFEKPFALPIGDSFLSHYLREYGVNLCNDWFSKWFTLRYSEESKVILWSEEFRFFIQHFVGSAWDYLIKYVEPDTLTNLFKWYGLNRHECDSRLVKLWEKKTLEDSIVFLYMHFNPDSDPKHYGVFSPDWRDDIAGVRSILIEYALDRASTEAEQIYLTLCQKITNFDATHHIKKTLQEKKSEHSIQLNITEISELLLSNGIKIIKSNDDLTKWIIDLLYEFEKDVLNGENGICRLLWDEPVGRKPSAKPKPKHEEALSDLLYHWFQWRKLKTPILPSRELQIFRNSDRNNDPNSILTGQKLDIHLGFKHSIMDFKTIIEVKKSINPEIKNGKGIKKLKGYLDRLGINSGIFLIGNWNGTGETMEKISELIDPQIQKAGSEGYKIYTQVITIN